VYSDKSFYVSWKINSHKILDVKHFLNYFLDKIWEIICNNVTPQSPLLLTHLLFVTDKVEIVIRPRPIMKVKVVVILVG